MFFKRNLPRLLRVARRSSKAAVGSPDGGAGAPLPLMDEALATQLYVKWQALKWQWKNYQRASGGESSGGPTRAWETHTLDRDYPGWFKVRTTRSCSNGVAQKDRRS